MFTDPAVERLWHAGKIRAACDASSLPTVSPEDDPYRDRLALLHQATRLHEHGVLCWYNARYPEAVSCFSRALRARRDVLGASDPDTLDTLERQAVLERSDDKLAAVITSLTAALGERHVRVAIARRNIAVLLRDEGRVGEAREMLERAAPVIQLELAAQHPETVALLKVDALLCLREGEHERAIAVGTRAMARSKQAWGAAHPFTASAELTVATAELRSNQLKSARRRFPSIIERLEAGYGDHPLLAIALWRFAELDLASEQGLQDGERDMRRALAIYEGRGTNVVGMEWTLFQILSRSRRLSEANEVALAMFARAQSWMQRELATHMIYHWRSAGNVERASGWEARRAAIPDDARDT